MFFETGHAPSTVALSLFVVFLTVNGFHRAAVV